MGGSGAPGGPPSNDTAPGNGASRLKRTKVLCTVLLLVDAGLSVLSGWLVNQIPFGFADAYLMWFEATLSVYGVYALWAWGTRPLAYLAAALLSIETTFNALGFSWTYLESLYPIRAPLAYATLALLIHHRKVERGAATHGPHTSPLWIRR